jgi:hypothetical protein
MLAGKGGTALVVGDAGPGGRRRQCCAAEARPVTVEFATVRQPVR